MMYSASSIPKLEDAVELQEIAIARATGPFDDNANRTYLELRKRFLESDALVGVLPKFLSQCRDLHQFWGYIKARGASYQERRDVIWDELRPLIELLERGIGAPSDNSISFVLQDLNAEHVDAIWRKALDRRQSDPEAAITAARTLLESVCKLILDESGVEYAADAKLPKLYSATADILKLAPSQHTEEVFKQILGGCKSVVEGLGAVRNRLSDAHGMGKAPVRPQMRHAELAVNLAGAMATFLVATWQERRTESDESKQPESSGEH